MTSSSRIAAVAITILSTNLLASHAVAQDESACKPFRVISDGTERSVDFVDAGADGPGPGDQRVGYRTLTDEDGQPAGYMRWVRTVLDNAEGAGSDGEHMNAVALVLDDGQIHIRTISLANNPAQDTNKPSFTSEQSGIVIGGTGAYLFARGAVDYRLQDGLLIYDLNIRCD